MGVSQPTLRNALSAENDGWTMFKRKGPTYTDYGSDAPRQRLRAKWWLATALVFLASILWALWLFAYER